MCDIETTKELQDHYYCISEGVRRGKIARADLNKIFYKNGITFVFDKYVTKLKVVLNVSEKYGVPIYEEHMLEHLLYQIMLSNREFKT